MGNRIVAIICTVAALAGIVFLGIGVKKYSEHQDEVSAVYIELSNKLNALEGDKRSAQTEITRLRDSVTEAVDAVATVTMLFNGMSDMIYTDAYPVLQEYGLTGTIVMTGETLPGSTGRLNDGQIAELVGAGWKLIPGWSDGDGENGIASADEWIRTYGYTVEGVVYVPQNEYTSEREELLKTAGYNTVVTDIGMGGNNAVSTEEIGEMWRLNAMGYQGNGPKSVLLEAISSSGHLTFTVGFERSAEMYDAATLPSMLSYLRSYEQEGVLDNTDIASARMYRADLDARRKNAEADVSARIAELEAEIASIDEQIRKLYNEAQS